MTGYGVLRPGEYMVGLNKLVIDVEEDMVLYRRFQTGKCIVSKKLHGIEKLELIPLYPVFMPTTITKYVEIEFVDEIVIPRNKQVTLYVKMPVDVGVYVYSGKDDYKLIDVFNVDVINYSLYGSIVDGIIARYYRSETYADMPDPVLGEAIVKLVISNRGDKTVEVKRVILDAQIIKMHYIPGTWKAYTQEVYMNVLSRERAIITYGASFVKNAVEIRDPEGFKPPRLRGSNEMIWGLK